MADVIPVPTMSTQGFVTDLSGKLDMLLAHFFLSDFNQTQLYPGQVISLPELIQRVGGDAGQTAAVIKRSLQAYLGRYYVNVQVDCTSTVPLEDATIAVELLLQIGITESDRIGQFQRLVKAKSSRMTEIIKINNG